MISLLRSLFSGMRRQQRRRRHATFIEVERFVSKCPSARQGIFIDPLERADRPCLLSLR